METEAMDPHAKRRKTEAGDSQESSELLTPPPALAADALHLEPSSETRESSPDQEPHLAGDGHDGVDRISGLPDEILGEIISLLPTKDGARTQTLASRWRHLWLSAPLNINHRGIPYGERLHVDVISRILASHPGPARRFSVCKVPTHPDHCTAMVDTWFKSLALNNLQELEFEAVPWRQKQHLPASAFRFSATLRVVTIGFCHVLDGVVESLRFPQLKQLALVHIMVSVAALHSIIAGCPKLECLLITHITKVDVGHTPSIRINSPSLIRIGFAGYLHHELIIEDAPSLERLFCLDLNCSHVSVISAPKLEIVGGFTYCDRTKLTIGGATVIEGSRTSFTTTVRSVKFLSINNKMFCLDTVINLMQCFPCLEKLSVQISNETKGKNLWRRKYRGLIRCLDIRLKVLVLKNYQGTESQVNFVTFFIMNAKMLDSIRFEGGPYKGYNKSIAKQHKRLQLEKRASRCVQIQFISCACPKPRIKHVNDLSKADPYECIC